MMMSDLKDIDVDTVKMRECGNDIILLVQELRNTIDTMFKRINEIPTITHEWVGESAINFANLASIDKVQYVNYANALYNYGKYLIDCADYYEKLAIKVRSY